MSYETTGKGILARAKDRVKGTGYINESTAPVRVPGFSGKPQCPAGQHWDEATQVCVLDVVAPVEAPIGGAGSDGGGSGGDIGSGGSFGGFGSPEAQAKALQDIAKAQVGGKLNPYAPHWVNDALGIFGPLGSIAGKANKKYGEYQHAEMQKALDNGGRLLNLPNGEQVVVTADGKVLGDLPNNITKEDILEYQPSEWGSDFGTVMDTSDNVWSAGDYSSTADFQDETGIGDAEWDTSHADFSWDSGSDSSSDSGSDYGSSDSGETNSSGGSISNDSFDNDDDAGGWSWNEGGMIHRNNGGFAGHARGTDTVPAMLSEGEFVVDADSARQFPEEIKKINDWEPENGGYEEVIRDLDELINAVAFNRKPKGV